MTSIEKKKQRVFKQKPVVLAVTVQSFCTKYQQVTMDNTGNPIQMSTNNIHVITLK